jgi:hypothetical protein
MVPMAIIILVFLTVFSLTFWQYFQIDPKRRILNLRFAMMVGAIAGSIGYPIYNFFSPRDRPVSWLLLALGLFWLTMAYYMLRHMPPRDTY